MGIDELNSGSSNNENEGDDESIKPISEEEGLKSAKNIFKSEGSKAGDSGLDEDKEFLKYLQHRKRAEELGLENPKTTTYHHYQGGVHFANSTVKNHGSVVGNDQIVHSNTSAGGFSGEARDKSPDKESFESIEVVFDKSEDIKQRSFMISLSALNGCNYRTVVEASQRLQSILQSYLQFETKVDTEA